MAIRQLRVTTEDNDTREIRVGGDYIENLPGFGTITRITQRGGVYHVYSDRGHSVMFLSNEVDKSSVVRDTWWSRYVTCWSVGLVAHARRILRLKMPPGS
jgi:hypothetical protein